MRPQPVPGEIGVVPLNLAPGENAMVVMVGVARGKSAIATATWVTLVTGAEIGMAGVTGGPSGETEIITTAAVLVDAHDRGLTRVPARPRFETAGGRTIGDGERDGAALLDDRGHGHQEESGDASTNT